MLGVIDARLRDSHATLPPGSRHVYDRVRAILTPRFDSIVLQTLLQTGSRLTPADIESTIHTLETRLFGRALLSERETQVLQRIATGATDREIADDLFISPRTVHSHVSHILTKLDASTRRAAVKRAIELDLIRTE